MKKPKLLPVLLLSVRFFTLTGSAIAYETDNFTHRNGKSATRELNDYIKSELQKAVDAANQEMYEVTHPTDRPQGNDTPSACSTTNPTSLKLISRFVSQRLAGQGPVSRIELALRENSPASAAVRDKLINTPWNESIYFSKTSTLKNNARDKAYPILALWQVEPSLNLNGNIVGIDKLGHFFGDGFRYFEEMQKPGSTLSAIRSQMIQSETGAHGLLTTGVGAWGDIAANFSGLRFFSDLYSNNEKSLVLCKEGKFELNPNQAFDISNYVGPSWDEGINCSEFSALNSEIVGENLKEKTCPIDEEKCKKISEDPCSDFYISKKCQRPRTDSKAECLWRNAQNQLVPQKPEGGPVDLLDLVPQNPWCPKLK